jgi:hypothetical protein
MNGYGKLKMKLELHIPMVYYHVWDNFPVPMYNKVYYDSTDYVVSISRVTEEIVKHAHQTILEGTLATQLILTFLKR